MFSESTIYAKNRSSQAGSAMMMALIAIGIVAILSFTLARSFVPQTQAQTKINFLNVASQIQLQIRNASNDPQSFAATVTDTTNNPGMDCLPTNTCPPQTARTPFVLWPAGTTNFTDKAAAIYDGTNPSAGFTLDGAKCTTFSMNGNANCPLHLNLKWTTCGTACTPAVTITADVIYRPGTSSTSFTVNDANYSLQFVQAMIGSSDPCAAAPSASEVAICQPPPYPQDKLFCLPSGWQCGQVYNP
jgi:type II secretory pathway pseudopilin PulG